MSEFPHRGEQEDLLAHLLIRSNSPQMVHVFGFPGTGKTSVVRNTLATREEPWLYISCRECSSSRSLYNRILLELSLIRNTTIIKKAKRGKSKKTESQMKLDSFACKSSIDFVHDYEDICKKIGATSIICVLDDVERIRFYEDGDPLPVIGRISEYAKTNCTLSLVTISDLPWQKLFPDRRFTHFSPVPIQIAFPNYNSTQLGDVLMAMRNRNGESTADNYERFSRLVTECFQTSCRDVMELNYQTRSLWEKHDMEESEGKTPQWKKLTRIAAQSGRIMFLRNGNTTCQMAKQRKYLLIAAFFTSYNPKNTDGRFFLKQREEGQQQRKKPRKSTKSSRRQQVLKGPKSFTLERLLTIYRLLTKNDEAMVRVDCGRVTNRLLTQITTLVSDSVLEPSNSNRILLNEPHYRCLAPLEVVEEIAKSINIDLKKCLVDYVDAA